MCVQHPTVKTNANHKSSRITNNHQTSPQIAQMVLITWLHSWGRETGYVVCSGTGYPGLESYWGIPKFPTFVTAAEDRTGRRASMTPVRKASKRNTCVMYGRWAQRIPGPMYMRLNLENTKYHNVLHIIFFFMLFSQESPDRGGKKWVPWFKQFEVLKCSFSLQKTTTFQNGAVLYVHLYWTRLLALPGTVDILGLSLWPAICTIKGARKAASAMPNGLAAHVD